MSNIKGSPFIRSELSLLILPSKKPRYKGIQHTKEYKGIKSKKAEK